MLFRSKKRRLAWADVVEATAQSDYRRLGSKTVPVNWYIRLVSKEGKWTYFQPDLYENGQQGLAFLERVLGKTFERPLTALSAKRANSKRAERGLGALRPGSHD